MYEIDRVLIAKSKKKSKKILSKIWTFFKKNFLKKNITPESKFSGWGLEINHSEPPWNILPTKSDLNFLEINEELLGLINNGDFKLTQFEYYDTNYKKILDELKWRHYLIFNSCLNLIQNTDNKKKVLVECGVCDGLTFFFAASALFSKNVDFEGFLYDSWSKFSFDYKRDIYDYSYLSVDIAKQNLFKFKKSLNFIEGNIPKTFKNSIIPKNIDFLHIDLNSSDATLDTLDFFYKKILSNGIIIFDDYGRIQYEKEVIDKFFVDKKGNFFSTPTGQAIFLKS